MGQATHFLMSGLTAGILSIFVKSMGCIRFTCLRQTHLLRTLLSKYMSNDNISSLFRLIPHPINAQQLGLSSIRNSFYLARSLFFELPQQQTPYFNFFSDQSDPKKEQVCQRIKDGKEAEAVFHLFQNQLDLPVRLIYPVHRKGFALQYQDFLLYYHDVWQLLGQFWVFPLSMRWLIAYNNVEKSYTLAKRSDLIIDDCH